MTRKYEDCNKINEARKAFTECMVAYAIYLNPDITTEELCEVFIDLMKYTMIRG